MQAEKKPLPRLISIANVDRVCHVTGINSSAVSSARQRLRSQTPHHQVRLVEASTQHLVVRRTAHRCQSFIYTRIYIHDILLAVMAASTNTNTNTNKMCLLPSVHKPNRPGNMRKAVSSVTSTQHLPSASKTLVR